MDTPQVVDKIQFQDVARTVEAAVNVFQGKTERMDDLLKEGGSLLRKASKNFSSTQLILTVATVAVVAIVVIKRAQDSE